MADEEKKQTKVYYQSTIPESGVWTVADLAAYMGNVQPAELQQRLSNAGIKVFSAGKNYRRKLVFISDIHKAILKNE